MGRMLTRANETWLLEPDWVASELGPIFEEMLEFDYTNPAAFVGD